MPPDRSRPESAGRNESPEDFDLGDDEPTADSWDDFFGPWPPDDLDLELDDEINTFADEVVRVAQRDLRAAPVVEDDELDVLGAGRPLDAGLYRVLKRTVVVERRPFDDVAEPQDFAARLEGHEDLRGVYDGLHDVGLPLRHSFRGA